MAASNPQNTGAYIPATNVWDVQQVYAVQGISPELKELLVRLYQNLGNMASVVNIKDSALFPTEEFVTSAMWYPDPSLSSATMSSPIQRNVFRMVVNFGPLPAVGTQSIPHNIPITFGVTFTKIYGAATNPSTSFLPLPYAAINPNDVLELNVDATNVNITTGGKDYSAWTVTYVVLEFLKF